MTSTVIKAGGPHRPGEALPFRFDDMHREGEKYLAEVRAAAGKIVADANTQADAIRKRAEQDGRQAALDAAQKVLDEKVTKQLATMIPAVRQAVATLEKTGADWLRHWESHAIHLATQIAARVVRQQLPQLPDVPLQLVREALELAVGSPRIVIRMNPADHAALGKHAERLACEVTRVAKAEVIADPTITPGGCRVETEYGTIDQQLESQLARIEAELT